MNNALSIMRAAAANEPKSVKIEVGRYYTMTNGQVIEVLAIRTNGSQTQIYYQYPSKQSFWGNTYSQGSMDLEEFKSRLRELGSINSITVTPLKRED